MTTDKFEVNPDRDNQYVVALPCSPKDFSEFVARLLGQPQTIGRRFKGRFEIEFDKIESLFLLLQQRLKQQNRSSLIQFIARIGFHDGSHVKLEGIDGFRSYTVVKPLVVNNLLLTWTFLVQFEDRNVPEKQTVEVYFDTNLFPENRFLRVVDSTVHDISIPPPELAGSVGEPGIITTRISHTARTWGEDIDSLISGHILQILDRKSIVAALFEKWAGAIGAFVGGVWLFVALLIPNYFNAASRAEQLVRLDAAMASDSINEKLDFLVFQLGTDFVSQSRLAVAGYFIVVIVLSVIVGILVSGALSSYGPSALLLSQESNKMQTKRLRRYNRKILSPIVAFALSVFASLAANFLYQRMIGTNLVGPTVEKVITKETN